VPETLTPGDGQDALARFKDAWQRRDVDAIVESFSEDAEYRIDPFTEPLQGSIAIREHWNHFVSAQSHVDFDAERVWVVGRTVLASWHAAYTRRSTAARIRVRGFSTIELDDAGLIMRMRDWPTEREVGTDRRSAPEEEPEIGEKQDG
jgi:ketosteroid isomerase-like protein